MRYLAKYSIPSANLVLVAFVMMVVLMISLISCNGESTDDQVVPPVSTTAQSTLSATVQSTYLETPVLATNCASITQIPKAECEALLALYTSTNGPEWTYNTGWDDTDTPCSWFGVTCEEDSVTSISLPGNGLSGSIPDLSALTRLVRIDLRNNQLSGSIQQLQPIIIVDPGGP